MEPSTPMDLTDILDDIRCLNSLNEIALYMIKNINSIESSTQFDAMLEKVREMIGGRTERLLEIGESVFYDVDGIAKEKMG